MDRRLEAPSEETIAMPAVESSASSTTSRISHTSSPDEGRFVPGTLLGGGRYRIIGLLGQGGMGEVYRATDLMLGQPVALKLLPESAASNQFLLERFHGEVRVARQVSHPNVCRVYDIGEAEGLPFISMEYVDGEDLSTLLQRIGRLPSDKALDAARQICAGLAAAHSKGVIHRDLKPQNIMMNRRGEIMIMDFGLAALADQVTGPEARHGTPAYMSPEQLKGGEVTAKSDIYALGLVIYELCTGKRPYEATSVQELIDRQETAQLTSMTLIASDTDPAVEKVIRRCLDPDPAKRPATPLAVSAALPGGDLLSAALAAGETPSPDLVANAGKTEGLARKYALLCLVVILACIFATPAIKQRTEGFFRAGLEYPPDVLQQKARELAANFGYTKKPADSTVTLNQARKLMAYLTALPGEKKWDEWLASAAPITASYREAAASLFAQPTGKVDRTNPAPIDPGMVDSEIDGHGRLLSFAAVPASSLTPIDPPIAPETVFNAAKLDFTKFSELTPQTIPRTAVDKMRAWRGPHPVLPNTPVTVEIGWWKGRVTHAMLIWPWMPADGATTQEMNAANRIRGLIGLVITAAGFIFAILLARRNWKLARADRRGALRLASFEFIVSVLVWAMTFHPAPHGGTVFLFFNGASDALFGASLMWLLYLALEPALRARWPHSIVTWNRLLAGRWFDAQVASHILIGAAVGVGLLTAVSVYDMWKASTYGLDTVGGLSLLHGPRAWIAGMLARSHEGVRTGFVVFFVIFGLRMLVRKDWIAAILAALIFASLQGDVAGSTNPWSTLGLMWALFCGIIFVLLRLGLVAVISAVFFLNGLNGMTLGTDLSAWSAPTGLATMTVLLAIVFFAFRQSLGNRDLLSGEEASG